MRTNIVIDEDLMDAAMRAGLFKTKKDAVEAGLKLLARQAADRPAKLLEDAAALYRSLRERGATIRSPVDVLLAAYCIEHDYALLHRDRDFDLLESLHGLKVWRH